VPNIKVKISGVLCHRFVKVSGIVAVVESGPWAALEALTSDEGKLRGRGS